MKNIKVKNDCVLFSRAGELVRDAGQSRAALALTHMDLIPLKGLVGQGCESPSHGGEGVPNVLLESAATGRACIASRIPGSIDVVDEGKTGYLFTAGNADELAACILRFLSLSHAEKEQMGIAGREKVERCFNRDIVINAYMDELGRC